jgi:tetratricopeptide (TPR) repeat protein
MTKLLFIKVFCISIYLFSFFSCISSKKSRNEIRSEKNELEFNYCLSEGTKERLLRNYSKAIELYKNCIRLKNNSSTSFYQLSLCYDETKKVDSAIFFAKYACDLNSASFWIMYNYARLSYKYNQIEEASKIYKNLISKFPQINFIYNEAAIVYLKSHEYEEAINIYNTLEKKYGITENVSLAKEKIYLTLHDKNKALLELIKLSEKFEKNVRYLIMLADFYLHEGKYSEAKKCYLDALKIEPGNGFINLAYADYFRKNNLENEMCDQLLQFFKDTLIENKTKLEVLTTFTDNRKGIILKEKNIEKLVNFLLDNFKDDNVLIDFAGEYYYRKGAYDKAISYYSLSVEKKTDNLSTWKNYLNSCLIKEDFKKAKYVANEALKYFPEQPFFYLYGAIGEFNLQNYNEALKLLEQGKAFVIDDAALEALFWYNLAEVYHRKNNHLESDHCFEKSISLDSTNLYVKNNYCFYLAARNENLKRARILAYQIIKKEYNNPIYLDTYSYILLKNGETDEAKKVLENSFSFGGENLAANNEHYGDVLFKLNDLENALKYWIKAQNLGNKSNDLKLKIDQLKEKK